MAYVAKRHNEELDRLKETVEDFRLYFNKNYNRFNEFRKFVFKSTMSDDDISALQSQKKPQLEFNINEAFISRLRGEFAKYVPEIVVSSKNGQDTDPQLIEFIEGHIRYILNEANNNGTEYNVYTDTLSGGFSSMKVWTEYADEKSFDQTIKFGRCFDPCLVGFDILAMEPHKGDGNYCFEIYPKTRKEFERLYPDVDLKEINFSKSLQGFNWSYQESKKDILLICDFYEKKKKRVKIVRLANEKVMTMDEYKEFVEEISTTGQLMAAPEIIEERYTDFTTICRYRFMETEVLEYIETDYKQLPIIFADGNSIILREGTQGGAAEQMTRPYVYHIKDAQKLKNFAGQTLANELENMVQHRFMIAKEAIPPGFEQAYIDVQTPSTLVYNYFNNNDPNQPLPPPQIIPRTNIPSEIMNTFGSSDQLMQTILGSYDPEIGKLNDTQLSGIAIIESASMGNAAAMPYIVGFLQALNQIAQVILDLIPKYYITPRTVPILDKNGHRSYVKINQQGGIDLKGSNVNELNIKVEAGVSFGIQKSRALQQITALMQTSPLFQQFMNEKGLPILLDNVEFRGIDQLKQLSQEWMVQLQQQKQMEQQQAAQSAMNNPLVQRNQIETMKLQQKAQMEEAELKLKSAELALEKEKLDNERIQLIADMQEQKEAHAVQMVKAQTEQQVHAVDAAVKMAQHHHERERDIAEHQHKAMESHLNRNI